MTTAYVVQVNLPKGIKYLGQSGKLQLVPKFFLSAPAVRGYLTKQNAGYGDSRYGAARHSELTKVITIRDLQLGLKDSKADIHFYGEWLERTTPGKKPLNNPNAVYKVQLQNGKLVSFGRGAKFGRVWGSAGHLRSHITMKLGQDTILFKRSYANANVIEIVHAADGINIAAVNSYPIEEFYRASPGCNEWLDRHNEKHAAARKALREEYA